MKTFLLLLLPFFSYAQDISIEIDEFTNAKTVMSKWLVLRSGMSGMDFYRIRKVYDIYLFEVKKATGAKGIISEDCDFMLKMADGEIIKMPVLDIVFPCKGCGARGLSGSALWGVHAIYVTTESQLKQLASKDIEKFRMYFTKGFEEETINKKNKKGIKSLVARFLETG
jgi:hypothetical protein